QHELLSKPPRRSTQIHPYGLGSGAVVLDEDDALGSAAYKDGLTGPLADQPSLVHLPRQGASHHRRVVGPFQPRMVAEDAQGGLPCLWPPDQLVDRPPIGVDALHELTVSLAHHHECRRRFLKQLRGTLRSDPRPHRVQLEFKSERSIDVSQRKLLTQAGPDVFADSLH